MLDQLYLLPILLFSVVIHEIAHGYMALRLGDPTARDMGRLTLNPIPHIDLVGSIIVPLFSLLAAGRIFIAWAKPVPVDPRNFSNFKRDDVLVSVVGPASNIVLAFCCSVAVIVLAALGSLVSPEPGSMAGEGLSFLLKMFYGGIYLNVILAVFNLIPIPPLDGSHLLASVLPDELAYRYRSLGFFGIFIVILLMRVPAFNSLFFSIIHGIVAPLQLLIDVFV
jgi:Zn-dependent protease